MSVSESAAPFFASRNHLELGFNAGTLYVRDLGSVNGTHVAGHDISAASGGRKPCFSNNPRPELFWATNNRHGISVFSFLVARPGINY